MMLAVLVPDDRERLAPVALAAEEPVAQLVVDRAAAEVVVLEPSGDLLLRLRHVEPVEEAGVDQRAVAAVRGLLDVAAGDDLDDRQLELARELPVALVVARHAHDRASAVARHHVVGDPDRDALLVDGIDGVRAGEDAGLLLGQIRPLELALARGLLLIGLDGLALLGRCDDVDQLVLGREHHERGAEERVRACGEHPDRRVLRDLVAGLGARLCDRKDGLGPDGLADPVALHRLDLVGPVQVVEILEQSIGVGGDAQHPLAHRLAHDLEATDFADPVDDLFVGEHGAERGAPVDGSLGDVGQALLVELEEDPLRPLEVVGIGRGDLARPVVAEPQ